MGVTGLWQLLQDAGRPVSLETLEGKILAVDISIWLHQAIKGMRDKHGNPVANAHLISVFNKVCKLLFYRIKPVFVFDGGVPALKKKTLAGRRERKQNAQLESEKAASKLLMTSLKSYALQQVTGEGNSAPINLPTTSSAPDMFELPPIPIRRDSLEAPSSEDEAFEGYFESLLDIDIDSSDFKALTTELQHEVLTEIKDRRQMNNFRKVIKELPEDSKDFSEFQLTKLLKQNKLSSRIEGVRKEMNEQQTGEITGGIDGGLYGAYEVESRRVASDNTSHLVLVKGLGKRKKQIELAHRKEQERLDDLKNYFENIKSEKVSDDITDSETDELKTTCSGSEKEKICLHDHILKSDCKSDVISIFPQDAIKNAIELSAFQQDTVKISSDSSTFKMNDSSAVQQETVKRTTDSSTFTRNTVKRTSDSHTNIDSSPTSSKLFRNETEHDVLSEKVSENCEMVESSAPVSSFSNVILHVSNRNHGNQTDVYVKENLTTQTNIPSKDCDIERETKNNLANTLSSTEVSLSKSQSRDVNVVEFETKEKITSEDFKNDNSTNLNLNREKGTAVMFVNQDDQCKDIQTADSADNLSRTTIQTEKIQSVNIDNSESESGVCTCIYSSVEQNIGANNTPIADGMDCLESITVIGSDQMNKEDTHKMCDMKKITESGSEPPSHNIIKDRVAEPVAIDRINEDIVSSSDEETDDFVEIPDQPYLQIVETENDVADEIKEITDDEDEESGPSLAEDFNNRLQHGVENFQQNLRAEAETLQAEHGKQQRMAVSMTDHIYVQVQELLSLFGLPYVISPMEAEAQCAYLERSGLTHGTITDDSDIWLFGGEKVYKNFFNQSKLVEFFKLDDFVTHFARPQHFFPVLISNNPSKRRVDVWLDEALSVTHFDLDRDQLINIALLCGSDYTTGIQGVGPATAMGILEDFPGGGQAGLKAFKKWWTKSHKEPILMSDTKLRSKLRRISVQPGFPDERVVEAYLQPEVDDSTETFTWGMPDLDSIRDFTSEHLRWPQSKTDELLVPVIKQLSKPQSQRRITGFFTPEAHELAARQKANKGKRKLLQKKVATVQRKPRKGAMKTDKQSVKLKTVVCLSESSSSDSESHSEKLVTESTETEGTKTAPKAGVSSQNSSVKGAKTKSSKNRSKSTVSKSSKYTKRSISSHMPL